MKPHQTALKHQKLNCQSADEMNGLVVKAVKIISVSMGRENQSGHKQQNAELTSIKFSLPHYTQSRGKGQVLQLLAQYQVQLENNSHLRFWALLVWKQ